MLAQLDFLVKILDHRLALAVRAASGQHFLACGFVVNVHRVPQAAMKAVLHVKYAILANTHSAAATIDVIFARQVGMRQECRMKNVISVMLERPVSAVQAIPKYVMQVGSLRVLSPVNALPARSGQRVQRKKVMYATFVKQDILQKK